MDEIAAASEFSKGALYLYFKSKEDIQCNIISGALSIMRDMFLEATSKQMDLRRKLYTMGWVYIKFYEEYPGYYRLLSRLYDQQTLMKTYITEALRQIAGLIEEICNFTYEAIEEGKRTGLFRENTDSAEVAVSLWSSSIMFVGLINHLDSDDSPGRGFRILPFADIDMKSLSLKNCKRIIYSILKNPPADFEDM
jgi:AcrR family transcriptional regulator